MTRAANEEEFQPALTRLGLLAPFDDGRFGDVALVKDASAAYTVYDLVAGFTAVIDGHLQATRSRTDISETAQLTAAESLSVLCGQNARMLWGESEETVQKALRGLGTERGFARLTHDFFARFARRYIEYHLSRELSSHVGLNRRFAGVDDHNRFLRQLDDHCRVATGVVRQFAGQWYSKHQ